MKGDPEILVRTAAECDKSDLTQKMFSPSSPLMATSGHHLKTPGKGKAVRKIYIEILPEYPPAAEVRPAARQVRHKGCAAALADTRRGCCPI